MTPGVSNLVVADLLAGTSRRRHGRDRRQLHGARRERQGRRGAGGPLLGVRAPPPDGGDPVRGAHRADAVRALRRAHERVTEGVGRSPAQWDAARRLHHHRRANCRVTVAATLVVAETLLNPAQRRRAGSTLAHKTACGPDARLLRAATADRQARRVAAYRVGVIEGVESSVLLDLELEGVARAGIENLNRYAVRSLTPERAPRSRGSPGARSRGAGRIITRAEGSVSRTEGRFASV